MSTRVLDDLKKAGLKVSTASPKQVMKRIETMRVVKNALTKIRYKEGWIFSPREADAFELEERPEYPVWITIRFDTVDPITGNEGQYINHKAIAVWEDITEGGLALLVFEAILEAEKHEAKEWFFFDGQQIYPPHPSKVVE